MCARMKYKNLNAVATNEATEKEEERERPKRQKNNLSVIFTFTFFFRIAFFFCSDIRLALRLFVFIKKRIHFREL